MVTAKGKGTRISWYTGAKKKAAKKAPAKRKAPAKKKAAKRKAPAKRKG